MRPVLASRHTMRPYFLLALPGPLLTRRRPSFRRARLPALALLAALPACRAFAQEAPAAPSDPCLVRADSVVVTATRGERSAEDVPVSVTVVPRETIENAPSRTLDDALRNVVGLNLPLGSSNTIQPTTNHVSMRGLGGDRALVLLDGVPLNDAVNGYVPWNKAPLGTVERV